MDASVTAISSTDSTYSGQITGPADPAGSNSAPGAAQAGTPATAGSSASKQDEVKLSAAAQAQSLYEQGETVQQIAEYLGCPVREVNMYLGIINSTAPTISGAPSPNGTTFYGS